MWVLIANVPDLEPRVRFIENAEELAEMYPTIIYVVITEPTYEVL